MKNDSLENETIRFLEGKDFLPFRSILEESAHTKRRAPVEIAARIVAVSQKNVNRNDALMLIVGERHENMNNTRFGLAGGDTGNTKDESTQKKSCGAMGHCDDSSNSFIQLLPLRTSRGRVPSGGPTMPSFS